MSSNEPKTASDLNVNLASKSNEGAIDDDRTVLRRPTAESGSLPDTPATNTPATNSINATSASLPGRRAGEAGAGADPRVRQVGRYQVLDRLGEGAMATVYRAYDPSIDRQLAIKFLHPDLCVDPEYRMRFLREAKAAGTLMHPNIVTIFDVGEIEGRPYIAMELLDGGPLNERTGASEALPIRDVLSIGMQLASALDFAHSRGIFHRDIKPGNIVRLKGSSTVKVTDFGIAHMETAIATQATRIGTVIGTPHYMSPEQAMGQRVDARSDLFSVGIVLYQLLTGQRPFNADSVVTLVFRIAKEDPRPIEELRKEVPAGLRRIIDRCLNKQPDRRFQSGRELAEAIGRVVRELDDAADGLRRTRGLSLRIKWPSIMAAVVAGTMLVCAGVINSRQQRVMLDQMVDHGASLIKLIAAESAVSALNEDWVSIDVAVQDVARTLQLERLVVADKQNAVRVSTDPSAIGRTYERAQGARIGSRDPTVSVQRIATERGVILDFQAPIRFQDRQVGTIRLGLFDAPLVKLAYQSWLLMLLLLLVTVAAAVIAMYYIAAHYSKPIRLLKESMDEIGAGRLAFRIKEKRDDELGVLYRTFDRMAEQLEQGWYRHLGSLPSNAAMAPPKLPSLPADQSHAGNAAGASAVPPPVVRSPGGG